MVEFSITDYHNILCPKDDFPSFIEPYCALPILKRLEGIGLLCGTDWTPLYHNRFYYSRLDHSIGVALIVWNFTHDKAQTLAGLFHDASTTVFSHVSDFRKGDALTQSITEEPNAALIKNDRELNELLRKDGLRAEQICDYHVYPIADNEIPQLSADRLEYMFPSGAALQGNWTLSEVEKVYKSITVLKNEEGQPELGFTDLENALLYTEKFLETSHVLQKNENKLSLQLLAEITNLAIKLNIIREEDCFSLSEAEVIKKFEEAASLNVSSSIELKNFSRLFKTFRTMKSILHITEAQADSFCVNLKVKQRYINPLVKTDSLSEDVSDSLSNNNPSSLSENVSVALSESGSSYVHNDSSQARRLSEVSENAAKLMEDFLSWEDTPFGCVKLAD